MKERVPDASNPQIEHRAMEGGEKSPRTESGQHIATASVATYVAPRTGPEESVASIWGEVLGIDHISVNENFLDLGGDSILAVQVIARMESVLGLELSVYDFFEAPTVEAIAKRVVGSANCESGLQKTDRATELPLLSGQRRLWFLDQLEGGNAAYHVPVAKRLRGALDLAALHSALDELLLRHEALRTTFENSAGVPLAHIAPNATFRLRLEDVKALSEEEQECALERHLREELAARFDLSNGPLIRGRLLRLSDDDHVLLITMHRIISDEWSVGVLLRELVALYVAYREGQVSPLPPLSFQYVDYAHWQDQWLAGAVAQEQLKYWRIHWRDAPELLELPTDRPRGSVQSYRGASVPLSIEPELTQELKVLARRSHLTLAMVLYAAWSILLSKLSGQEDIVVGIAAANRRFTEVEDLIGLFANTLAVRVRIEGDPVVEDVLYSVKRALLGAYAHQDLPFEKVVDAVQPPRSESYSPIFQVLFIWDNMPHSVIQLPGLILEDVDVAVETAQFDLSLSLRESGEEIAGKLNYARDLYDESTIKRWVASFRSVIRELARGTQMKLSRLMAADEDERHRVVALFNATQTPYPHDQLLHQLFEQQAQRTPDAVALLFEDRSLTYAELNARANRLARHLIQTGIGPDQLVGVCMERSLEMVIALFGILKAGAGYVPLDPGYPAERLAYMLADSSPQVLLIQQHLRRKLPRTSAEVICLDAQWETIAQQSDANPCAVVLHLTSRNLAYVIYTSGSTGKPKGAMNEHRGVVNRLRWMQDQYRLGSDDVVLQKTPFSFDVSVWEFFWTLSSGSRLVIARPEGHKDPGYLRNLITRTGVTTLHFVPSMLQAFLAELPAGHCASLRHIVCSGEELPATLQKKCFAALPYVALSNLYGPTEAAVDVTAWECQSDDPAPRVSIGRPIANIQMYLLNRHGQPVPVGVTGELYIGGIGVGRGYLNRPQLTAERFVADPFSADPQARMYKTGDLGQWRADGAIDYLGRNDHQVKIRGFRIELGEIEAQLLTHPQVKQAAVLARDEGAGDKRLVAYLVPQESAPAIDHLRSHLKTTLPEHMVPSAFVALPRMPLTPNGKLDRRSLPAPDSAAYVHQDYEAPQGDLEHMLADIWRSLLGVERVGRRDNFFQLGGHSLLILQMLERLSRRGFSIELLRIYQSANLADLANALAKEAAPGEDASPGGIVEGAAITPEMLPLVDLCPGDIERIVQLVPGGAANTKDIYPLTSLQEGILFHHLRNEGGGDTYVLPIVLSVKSTARLNELVAAIQAVIDRHDVLRTAVLWDQLPRPVQVVYRRATLPVERLILEEDESPEVQIAQWIHPRKQRLNLQQAPLMKLHVGSPTRGDLYVLLQLHHMHIDHVTLEIVISEIMAGLRGSNPARLPESIPFRDHVARVLARAATDASDDFFRKKLEDTTEPSAPFGLMDVHGDGSEIIEATEALPAALAHKVRGTARKLGVSPATIVHAAFGLLVARTSGRDDVVFGSVFLGRWQASAGMQRRLGMFINVLPLRLKLGHLNIASLIQHTHRELAELIGHEGASLAMAQRCSGMLSPAPLFTALLNYRHSVGSPDSQWNQAEGIRLIRLQERTNYPLTMSVDDFGDSLSLTAQTDSRIQASRVTGYMREAIQSLVELLDSAPEASTERVSILPIEERRWLTRGCSDASLVRPSRRLVHELFESQVERSPHAIAVVFRDATITYATLNEHSNRLARRLRRAGVTAGDFVGLYVERSIEMVVGILAILKAGGAYVPLDPAYPAERLLYMVDDSSPSVILTQAALKESLPSGRAAILVIPPLDARAPDEEFSGANLPATDGPSQSVAYLIYTSGSTGKPKGVLVPHRNVVRLFESTRQWFAFSESDVWTLFHSFAFDFSVWELWGGLFYGGRVILISKEIARSPEEFYRLICEQGVTVLNQTPSAFTQLIGAQSRSDRRHSLRIVIFGGEALDMSALRPWYEKNGLEGPRLVNMYGITETTVHVTYHEITREDIEGSSCSRIGSPIPDLAVYVLDANHDPVPIGVVGELYVGGAGVALGYLNRPELSAQRFLPNRFSTVGQDRLYKTGDLGRWRVDGGLDYLGRNDDQVKIRGFRIELGEIKEQLLRHRSVQDAAVIARKDQSGEQWLTAYVVPADASDEAGGLTADVLRAHLKQMLPDHMVPSSFVTLKAMPLTANGKLDRRRLPDPENTAYSGRDYQPPCGEIEETIVEVWRSLLSRDRIGRHDDFFELGGHSLSALRAANAISVRTNSTISVNDIYVVPTPAELAERISMGRVTAGYVDLHVEATLSEDIVAKPGVLRAKPRAVLLTGATGFVGRFLLIRLLENTDASVHCLVRAPGVQQGLSRIRASLERWSLWKESYRTRIVAVPGDLRLPGLGVHEAEMDLLARTIDCIYHCATSMNHLETYASSKRANVESAQSILKLATRAKPKVVNYVSTLSVFSPLTPRDARSIDEDYPIEGERHLAVHGYAASKWVAEKIFMIAGDRGIHCNIFRLGLIWADSQGGRYDEAQRFYRVFKSSLLSGIGIQNFQFGMPLTPVDVAAKAIVRLASLSRSGKRIFHIGSPVPAPERVFERLKAVRSLTLLPEREWMRTMVKLDPEGERLSVVPLIQAAAMMEQEWRDEEHLQRDAINSKLSCERTNEELKAAGIVWPTVNDDMIAQFAVKLIARETKAADGAAKRHYSSFATDDR